MSPAIDNFYCGLVGSKVDMGHFILVDSGADSEQVVVAHGTQRDAGGFLCWFDDVNALRFKEVQEESINLIGREVLQFDQWVLST